MTDDTAYVGTLDRVSPPPRTLLMQARVARGWSQERLAARAGISVRTVLRIEKGEAQPASATMTVLCAALGIEREVLWPDV